jgi:hypothetical protein
MTAEAKPSAFEGWAVVELMGHQREIGFVTTEAYGQAVLFRIDTPELPEREFELTAPEYTSEGDVSVWTPAGSKVKRHAVPARSRLVAPGSLYAINPCTEEAAITALERNVHRPLILVQVAPRKVLPPPEPKADEDEDEFEFEDSEDDIR